MTSPQVVVLLGFVCWALAAPAAGDDPGQRNTAAGHVATSPLGHLGKGDGELGLLVGAGVAHDWGGVGDRQFLTFGGRWGRILSGPTGPGFLNGNPEFVIDVLPVFLTFQESTVYGVSSTLLFRQYFSPDHHIRPFFTIGAGFLLANSPIPPESNSVKFTPQGGFGLAWFRSPGLAYFAAYRYVHVSNGGLSHPNPGINSSSVQFGVSMFRW